MRSVHGDDGFSTYTLSIKAQWARKFAKIIGSTHPNKAKKLHDMKPIAIHKDFTPQNDVVLDKIISIEKIDVSLYPKVSYNSGTS